MKIIELLKIEHKTKIGDVCGNIEPNVTEDSRFFENGECVGFYIRSIFKYREKLSKLIDIANAELLSDRVPKSTMKRSSGFIGGSEKEVLQYSAILGAVPPKPHMRRPYPIISSVHNCKTATNFIKAMLLATRESEDIIKNLTPFIFDRQTKIINEFVPPKFRFGTLFTSSISNFNISAPFHIDNANLKDCVNVIITKRHNAAGGNLSVPDYGITFDSVDDSMVVYPAWKNVHGVTPIVPLSTGGYRNSLIFYPLKSFSAFW